jgi:hypothetical protein
MSPRKLVQIADPPNLPTIKDYFGMMAEEQAEDIRRLKLAATGRNSGPPEKQPTDKPVPNPWLLHPTRRKPSAKKRGANGSTRSTSGKAPKKAAKKAAKKASKKARR